MEAAFTAAASTAGTAKSSIDIREKWRPIGRHFFFPALLLSIVTHATTPSKYDAKVCILWAGILTQKLHISIALLDSCV
jgi:hypothetical protein